ncbi:MAG TPA: MFS transporter [Gammaproteobacteria bacterium]|nr:MFS transporter [Gammaproteobacteria bacterium]
MTMFSSLNKEQIKTIAILQLGTFLEYFDLMLYLHLAVLLDNLFFPASDPRTTELTSAMVFSLTFILRPCFALIFGYIGDTVGRKSIIIFTTITMAISCLIMATLPTYTQIGIFASVAMVLCRVMQSISSAGEASSADIYLAEMVKPPLRYSVVSSLECAYGAGSFLALGVVSAVFYFNLEWRIAFWMGAVIAVVGFIAKIKLKEAPDFVAAKAKKLEPQISNSTEKKSVSKKTFLAYFLIQWCLPVYFYFTYIYCSSILKNTFHYSAAEIVNHNLIIALVEFSASAFLVFLSCKIYPLKIVKIRAIIFTIFIMFMPYLLSHIIFPLHLLGIQLFITVFVLGNHPAEAIFFMHFPIFKRFTYSGFLFSLSRAIPHTINAFLFIYLVGKFGNYGLLFIFVPLITGYFFSLSHFEKLEKLSGDYPLPTPYLADEKNSLNFA